MKSPPARPQAGLEERFRSGDEAAFEEVVRRHREAVYRMARRLLGSHDDADEAAQVAFVRAWRARSQFRGDASVRTWLIRIVMNVALNQLRTDRRRDRFFARFRRETATHASTSRTAQAAVEAHEVHREVHNAISALSPSLRAVVVLFDLEGLNCANVADTLRIPQGTVRSRLYNARRQLRVRLTPYLLGAPRGQ